MADSPTLNPARRWGLAAAIVAVTVALDQLTKWWALEALGDGSVIEVLPGLEFELTFNSGFSFSTGSGSGSLIGWLVIALSVVMVVVIARATSTVRVVLVAVVLGGALGNLADRIFRADDGFLSGEVVDFIDVTWYAVFNLADTFVVCGAIAFALVELRAGRDDGSTTPDSDANGADSDDGSPDAVDKPRSGD